MAYSIARTAVLHEAEVDAMFAVLKRYFHGADREDFGSGVQDAEWVVRVFGDTGSIVGFSLLESMKWRDAKGAIRSVLLSGDTIVEPSSWGSSDLYVGWAEVAYQEIMRTESSSVWWLLIVSGFRAYRALPVFFRTFYPCVHWSRPASVRHDINNLAKHRYGNEYVPEKGVVRWNRPQILKAPLSEIPLGRLRDPHIQYFKRANPRYRQGEELVCFAEISRRNLKSAGSRLWGRIHREANVGEGGKETMRNNAAG